MKLFSWLPFRRGKKSASSKDLLVPPELQQYYQVGQPAPKDGRRKKVLLLSGSILVTAAVITGAVLLFVHLTDKTSNSPKSTISANAANVAPKTTQASAKLPNSNKLNTNMVDAPL
jgi:hypothetical protein